MFNLNSNSISKNIINYLCEGAMSDISLSVEDIKKLANDEQGRYTAKLSDMDTMKQIAKDADIETVDGDEGKSVTFKLPDGQEFTVSALETMESEAPAKDYLTNIPKKKEYVSEDEIVPPDLPEEEDPEDITPEESSELSPEEKAEVYAEALKSDAKKIFKVKK